MDKLIFLDIETQLSKDDVGGWFPEKMQLAIAVTYDVQSEYRTWYESDVNSLVSELLAFDKVIGFNLNDFDYKVIYPYDNRVQTLTEKTLDILNDVYQKLGFRVKLDDLVKASIGKSKSGDGLQALRWWKEGQKKLVEEYCKKDVELTKELFEFGAKNKCIYYPSYNNLKSITVDWEFNNFEEEIILPDFITGIEKLNIIESEKGIRNLIKGSEIDRLRFRLYALGLVRTNLNFLPSGILNIEDEVYELKAFFTKEFEKRLSNLKTGVISDEQQKFLKTYEKFIIISECGELNQTDYILALAKGINLACKTPIEKEILSREYHNTVDAYYSFFKINEKNKNDSNNPFILGYNNIKSNNIEEINTHGVIKWMLSFFEGDILNELAEKQNINQKIEYLEAIKNIIFELSKSSDLDASLPLGLARLMNRLKIYCSNQPLPIQKLTEVRDSFKEFLNSYAQYSSRQPDREMRSDVLIYHPNSDSFLDNSDLDTMKLLEEAGEKINTFYFSKKLNDSPKGNCYIATMVYKDYAAPEVMILRRYRDDVLRKYIFGRLFIFFYYQFSPSLVKWFKRYNAFHILSRKVIEVILRVIK